MVGVLSIVIIFHVNLWLNYCSYLPKSLLNDLIMPGDQIFDLSKWLWPISLPLCTEFQGSFHHFHVGLICWFSLYKYQPPCHLTYWRGRRANFLVSARKLRLGELGGSLHSQEWPHLPVEITSILWLGAFDDHFTLFLQEVRALCGFPHIPSPGPSRDPGTYVQVPFTCGTPAHVCTGCPFR